MPAPDPSDEMTMHLATDLDARTVTTAYTKLLSLLDAVEGSDAVVVLELDSEEGEVSPLSMQLLISAGHTFSADRLTLAENAAAAVSALEQPKEI